MLYIGFKPCEDGLLDVGYSFDKLFVLKVDCTADAYCAELPPRASQSVGGGVRQGRKGSQGRVDVGSDEFYQIG